MNSMPSHQEFLEKKTLKETIMTIEELTKLVADKLHVGERSRERSEELAHMWFETENPMLGNISPNELIKLGKLNKVVEFVTSAEQ